MSDQQKVLDEQIKKDAELIRKKRFVEEARINRDYSNTLEGQNQIKLFQELDLSRDDPDKVEKIIRESNDYIKSARKNMRFISEDFDGVVPFHANNIILIGAYSGDGKSTITANVAYSLLKQKKNVLVISNEEKAGDIYNRVTCLVNGWSYNKHAEITEDQMEVFSKYVRAMRNHLRVVDNDSEGIANLTITYEGITGLLNSILAKGIIYDAIIIDYYQNVNTFAGQINAEPWKVQEKFANFLDDFKNKYPAPIVLLAQIKQRDKENETPFKDRIEGRKSLYNKATFAVEVRADKKNRRTEWTIHKQRFGDNVGESFYTGWDLGKYVRYDKDFQLKVQDLLMSKLKG